MKSKLLHCAFWLIAATCLTQTATAQATNESDSLALVDIYNSTNGPNWERHDNWL
ncbi:MAG: hypothetical protein INR73_29380, partial [Williamsia sp.]|nr:hypothetical protein [Williamsia sp.]